MPAAWPAPTALPTPAYAYARLPPLPSCVPQTELTMLQRAEAGEIPWDDVRAVVGEEYVRVWQVCWLRIA